MPLVTKACPNCGAEFARERWRHQQFCSVECGHPRGVEHPRFNGGLCFDKGKVRWVIHCRDGTLMLFSRAVMAAEIGRLLTPQEIVHHINGDTTDDRPENLELTTRAEHMNMHRADLEAGRRR